MRHWDLKRFHVAFVQEDDAVDEKRQDNRGDVENPYAPPTVGDAITVRPKRKWWFRGPFCVCCVVVGSITLFLPATLPAVHNRVPTRAGILLEKAHMILCFLERPANSLAGGSDTVVVTVNLATTVLWSLLGALMVNVGMMAKEVAGKAWAWRQKSERR